MRDYPRRESLFQALKSTNYTPYGLLIAADPYPCVTQHSRQITLTRHENHGPESSINKSQLQLPSELESNLRASDTEYIKGKLYSLCNRLRHGVTSE